MAVLTSIMLMIESHGCAAPHEQHGVAVISLK